MNAGGLCFRPLDSIKPLAAPMDVPAIENKHASAPRRRRRAEIRRRRHSPSSPRRPTGRPGWGPRTGSRRRRRASPRRKAPKALASPDSVPKDGTAKFHLKRPKQVEPHDQADRGDDIFPETADICRTCGPGGPRSSPRAVNVTAKPEDEKQGKDKRSFSAFVVSLFPATTLIRSGIMARTQGFRRRRDAAEKNGDDRQPGVVLDEAGRRRRRAWS